MNDTGRPEKVFGKPCAEVLLAHEIAITEAELLLGATFTSGVRVGKAIADAVFVRDGVRFWLEIDNQKMTSRQLRRKWKLYGKVNGYILVICHTKTRLRLLMKSARVVKNVTLFTRFRWLRSKQVQRPWIDWYGHRVSI